MRYKSVVIAAVVIMGILAFFSGKLFSSSDESVSGSIYDFKIKDLGGNVVNFETFRGKSMVIVNTASRCGYTPQYESLQELHETYGDKVAVLGFPSNNFLWQEPGSNEEIAAFCQKNYGVTFPIFEKISVRGNDRHPLYAWLSAKSGEKPSWNFCKYIVNREGKVTGFFGPKVDPMDEVIIKQIAN
jgi:glutathione peroxidase